MPLRVDTPSGQVTLAGDRPAVVGRGRDADVVIADSRVSRRHVAVEPHPDGWMARDVSSNGMWCDGNQVSSVRVAYPELRIRLGAPDGPELRLTVPRPVVDRPVAPPAEPQVDELATMLARGGPAAGNRVPAMAGGGTYQAAAPSPDSAPSSAATPARSLRWARTLPTFGWQAAAAFTLGALLALS